jgi:hypothetical protein
MGILEIYMFPHLAVVSGFSPLRRAASVSLLPAILIAGLLAMVLLSSVGCTGAAAEGPVSLYADPTLSIVTSSLPSGVQTVAYTDTQFVASGGTSPYTWSVAGGSTLPIGLTLSPSGSLAGAPTATGSFTFTIQVADSYTPKQTTTESYTVSVISLPAAVNALPTSTVGEQIKKQVLLWGISEAGNYATILNDTATSNSLLTDVANDFNVVFTHPTVLPANYFPAIPSPTTNPILAASIAYPYYLAGTSTGYDIRNPPAFHISYVDAFAADDEFQKLDENIRAFFYPGTENTLSPYFVPSILERLDEAVWTRGTGGSLDGDFTSAAHVPYMYLMIQQTWPQLILPTINTIWKQRLDQDAAFILAAEQAHFLKVPNDVANNWINADVRWFEAIAFDDIIDGNPGAHASVVAGGVAEMQQSLLPDGGSDYTDQQNENAAYHDFYVVELQRFATVTGNATALSLAEEAQWWSVLSMVAPVPDPTNPPTTYKGHASSEFVTANSWHKYWNQNTNVQSSYEVFGLTGNPYVLSQIQREGYCALNSSCATNNPIPAYYGLPGTNTARAISPTRLYYFAPFWRSDITPLPIPSNFIAYDRNILGPRGQQGTYSYMGTTRATPVSTRGKATFVGAMIQNTFTDATANNYSLNAAVESIGVQVVNAPCTNPANFISAAPSPAPVAGTCVELSNATLEGSMNSSNIVAAADEHNAQATTSTFGSLSSVHNISGYGAAPTSWIVSESWLLLPTRIIGLVSVTNTASETAYRLQGAVRFISGVGATGTQQTLAAGSNGTWTYGDATIQIYANTFGGNVTTQLDNTWEDTAQKAEWLRLEDPNDSSASSHTWPAGTSHYFMAEIRPGTNAAATGVSSTFSNGLMIFQLADSGTQYIVADNPTASSIAYPMPPNMVTSVPSGTEYRPTYLPPDSSYTAPAPYAGTIPAYSHVVFHN